MQEPSSRDVGGDLNEQFRRLQARLPELFVRIFPHPRVARTVVVVPSLTLDTEQLQKIEGVHHYEERMLFLLMLLQLPNTKLVYVTSQPIPPSVIDYFLHLLPGIPSIHAKRRLTMLPCYDGSSIPLAQKILNRPRLIARILSAIAVTEDAHLSCFTTTPLERELALRLGIPVYGNDPALSYLGNKSCGREILREAGILVPDGHENLHSEEEIAAALCELKARQPSLRRAVIKLNEGFSGEGNSVFDLHDCPSLGCSDWIRRELPRRIQFEAKTEQWEHYREKFQEMGGVVESFVEGANKRSPSVQCRINPVGQVEVVSTHDQILGGPSGQIFLGCTFPADTSYRREMQEAGRQVGELLRDRGVIGRFGVDFVSVWQEDHWAHYAIEINLRKGGTTHPFMMLQFLTNGEYHEEDGTFVVPGGQPRYYLASDNVHSEAYKGLCPEDLIDIAVQENLHFHRTIQQGVIFHLIGALSEFGKFGVVCVGDSPQRAQAFYDQTIAALNSA